MGMFHPLIEIPAGILMGFAVGFIFPAISADNVKVHSGYNLYSMGFAGGLIATILATGFRAFGLDIVPAAHWSTGNNLFFAVLLYSLAASMLLIGFTTGLRKNMHEFIRIQHHPGILATDFFRMHKNSVYINMGFLCIIATTLVIVIGADLNGPTMAGILTMTGFGALGKHLYNVIPVMAGAIIAALTNQLDPTAPSNIIAILFSTGLAPIAGKFGVLWGFVAGFLHVGVANYIGDLNMGMNLYNNGFAATFVVMFLLPVITVVRRGEEFEGEKYK
jgi:hypothetical protein